MGLGNRWVKSRAQNGRAGRNRGQGENGGVVWGDAGGEKVVRYGKGLVKAFGGVFATGEKKNR